MTPCVNLWKSTDRGDNWTAISVESGPGATSPGALMVTATTSTSLPGRTSSGTPSRRQDHLDGHLRRPADLAEPPWPCIPWTPGGVLHAVRFHAASEKVYVTQRCQTWTNISANLPNVPVNSIVPAGKCGGACAWSSDVGVFCGQHPEQLAALRAGLPTWSRTGSPSRTVNGSCARPQAWAHGKRPLRRRTASAGLVHSRQCGHLRTRDAMEVFNDASLESSPGWDWQFPGGDPAVSSDPRQTVLTTLHRGPTRCPDHVNPLPEATRIQRRHRDMLPHEMQVAVVVDEETWTDAPRRPGRWRWW